MEDRQHLAKLLNSAMSAMFATFREAELPQDILDGIIANNKQSLSDSILFLRQSDISDRERAMKANIISWAINTIAIAGELGMVLEKNEDAVAQLLKLKKPPKGFG